MLVAYGSDTSLGGHTISLPTEFQRFDVNATNDQIKLFYIRISS